MDILNLTVVLPTGNVSVPVEAKSTPGHLKENLKYSLRIPPKLIKLTCDGRELNDIKTMEQAPNNVKDGCTLVAQRREALTEEEEEAAKAAEDAPGAEKQVIIQKDTAPPKPKPKSSVIAVRAVLKEGDVVKTSTLKPGRHSWKPQFIEGKHPKRHLAFLRIETVLASKGTPVLAPLMPVRVIGLKARPELNGCEGVVEKFDETKGRWQTRLKDGKMLEVKPDNLVVAEPQGTAYPANDPHGSVVLALGDLQTSPVWTAAAILMEVGEKAEFTFAKKLVDFDPEGLAPTDSATTWRIELIRIVEAIDVLEDFSQLLHVVNTGSKERAEDLDDVRAHWRVRRWMAEGNQCIGSSRERIAIMPGHGLVNIEDQHAPPVVVSVGDGQQLALETVATRVGPGGSAHLYLKSEALKDNRPAGTIVFEVELVDLGQNRGPGSPGFQGWQSLVNERTRGDGWLDEADNGRQQLQTFSTLQKSTGGTKAAEEHTVQQVHKFADNAMKRYQRVLKWMEAEADMDAKTKQEKMRATMRMAKALALSHQRFGEAAEAEAEDAEKSALVHAQSLLKQALDFCESEGVSQKDMLEYECLMTSLQISLQAQDAAAARTSLDELTKMKPDEADDLKSFAALINRLETSISLKKGANAIEEKQKELQEAVTSKDKAKVIECLEVILDMLVNSKVTWEKVRTCKVGKDVGLASKMGDPDITKVAQTCVQQIQALATRAGLGL